MNENDLTPPGYWGASAENIHVVQKFLTNSEMTSAITYAHSIKEWIHLTDNWNERVHNFSLIEKCGAETSEFFKSLTDRAKTSIQETMKVQLNEVSPSIVRWRVGDGQEPHADKQELDGTPNPYPENDIASLVYLNDDYEGGEIYFPNQNLQFKPNAGSLVFFPGDIYYLHGVTKVTEGTRYTMPNFWKVTNLTTEYFID